MRRTRIVAIALAIVCTGVGPVLAQQVPASPTVNTNGLTAEQVKALSAAADQLRVKPENTLANLTIQNATPQKFTEWADAGAAAGKAVSAFTKEVGIAADQFLKTDTGRIALLAVIWKLGGDQIVASAANMVLNLVLAVILLTMWWKMTRRFVFNERKTGTVSYHQNPILRWLGFNKREVTFEKDDEWMKSMDGTERAWVMASTRIGALIFLIIVVATVWPEVRF